MFVFTVLLLLIAIIWAALTILFWHLVNFLMLFFAYCHSLSQISGTIRISVVYHFGSIQFSVMEIDFLKDQRCICMGLYRFQNWMSCATCWFGTSNCVHTYAGYQPSDAEVEQLVQDVEKYTLASHLVWGLWGIISVIFALPTCLIIVISLNNTFFSKSYGYFFFIVC